MAEEAGFDLIEISPQATPPVCKILDYGKYKYEIQKRKAEAKKNQKIVETKELKLRPMIDTHDYEVKVKQGMGPCPGVGYGREPHCYTAGSRRPPGRNLRGNHYTISFSFSPLTSKPGRKRKSSSPAKAAGFLMY